MTVRAGAKDGDPYLNKRGSRYLGQVFVLKQSLTHGEGTLEIGDSLWRISGPDMPAGSSVKVVGQKATMLVVEAVSEDTVLSAYLFGLKSGGSGGSSAIRRVEMR